MKKAILIVLAVLIVISTCAGLWLFGYYNNKSNDNIPSKELMVTYLNEKGESYATEKIKGYKPSQLAEVWGEPQGTLFGMWGDIWETDSEAIIVYYDSDGVAEYVKFNTP